LSPLLWLLVFLAAGVAASLVADALFDGVVLAVAFAACLLLIGTLRLSHRTLAGRPSLLRELVLVLAHSLGLAAAFLFCAMACWLGGEIASGGRMPPALLWVGRIVLAELVGLMIWLLLKPRAGHRAEISRQIALTFACTGFAVALVLYLALTGPANVAGYPDVAFSPYRLPWPAGLTRLCIQSNRGLVSHRGWDEYAYDFAMPVGSVFCAARGGTVVEVVDRHDGNGLKAPNNYILMTQEDGSLGVYAHLRQGGSLVRVGQTVGRGEPLGLSGNVGTSMLPHLHFHVLSGRHTVPVSFADVPGDGVPRMFGRYTSGNEREQSCLQWFGGVFTKGRDAQTERLMPPLKETAHATHPGLADNRFSAGGSARWAAADACPADLWQPGAETAGEPLSAGR
jgi:murein DD-endopeptidase MepM/ murein hydrolase activator NlpD